MNYKVTIENAIKQLDAEKKQRFTTLLQNGSMSVEYYAPVKKDLQQPHLQDELYIIITGTGIFLRNNERVTFMPGDVLFVPAGMEHRFEEFTDDFATWVIFYGPEGGEKE
ncbi:MAG: cupin domain-containing protein [Bacteroidetes bacterium]|nr:cupin domain-containing protein [Bacteroidota bacterium]